jgi:hypothetical protein
LEAGSPNAPHSGNTIPPFACWSHREKTNVSGFEQVILSGWRPSFGAVHKESNFSHVLGNSINPASDKRRQPQRTLVILVADGMMVDSQALGL